jgi:putative ABC transport system ATP-binding protein
VLHDVSMQIEPGATALLGPSGSGKSTILRLLNRLADPDSGVVRMHGEDVRADDVLELRRRAVLVPQLPAPLPGTVAENVRYGPSLIGRTVEVEPLLARAGLDASYAERDASQLSVGEQQRDEIERTLLDLRERVSIVLVTHDGAQAERLTTRTVRIRDGRADA